MYAVFRHLAITGARPAPTRPQLAAIESLLGARLPEPYVEFLRVANGGYVEYAIDVPVAPGSTEPMSFSSIFAAADLPEETRVAREISKIPAGVLPFARTGGDSVAYLDLTPEGAGRVVAFVTSLPEWTGSSRHEPAFIPLADSFDAFVAKLYISRELVLDQLEHDANERSHVEATEAFLDIGLPAWRTDARLAAAVRAAYARVAQR